MCGSSVEITMTRTFCVFFPGVKDLQPVPAQRRGAHLEQVTSCLLIKKSCPHCGYNVTPTYMLWVCVGPSVYLPLFFFDIDLTSFANIKLFPVFIIICFPDLIEKVK